MGGKMKCRINDDKWENVGVEYFVHAAKPREDSTAVNLTIEDENGFITEVVVASHQIEWIDD